MIEIKNRFTGAVIIRDDAAETIDEAIRIFVDRAREVGSRADLGRANLSSANLSRADLGRANLSSADLGRANLSSADLSGADLRGADLGGANLSGADLGGANLSGADLGGANLSGAKMPCGRTFEEFKADPLMGICQDDTARAKAIAAWPNHQWSNCPMHSAHGWNSLDDVPVDQRIKVAAFVAIFDAQLLPEPPR